jgi:type II secretory pathway pseudopilin PulG
MLSSNICTSNAPAMKHKPRILLEFTAIICILSILAFGALDVFSGGRANAYNDIRQNHLSTLEDALEKYLFEQGSLPESNTFESDLISKGYLQELPIDPEPAYGYIYLVADQDNLEGGEKNQYYTVLAHSQGNNKPPFFTVGNATEEFVVTEETWQAIIAIAQTKNIVEVDSERAEGASKIAPDGGAGIFWH